MDFQKWTEFLTVKIESQNATYRDHNGRPTQNLHHETTELALLSFTKFYTTSALCISLILD